MKVIHFFIVFCLLATFAQVPAGQVLAYEATGELTLISGQEGSERTYRSEGTDFMVYINDEEDLLSADEEKDLLEYMVPITDYGHAAFMTTSQIDSSDYEAATRDIYHQIFGKDSGVIFLIDMNHRKLIIQSDGEVYRTITKSYADTITDNVYRMAGDGDYYGCASEAYTEMYTLLVGRKIAQPMRHITNAMLAVILSTVILYFISRRISKQRAAKSQEILSALGATIHFSGGQSQFSRRKKDYNPSSSSDSGGGGGGGFSGGGGGSSGGGGSHGF